MTGRRAETLEVPGGRPLAGAVDVPGDKSISHRALLLGALAEGTSAIAGLSGGDDVVRTRWAVEALGAGVTAEGDLVTVAGGATAWPHHRRRSTSATPAPACACWPGWRPPCPGPRR